MDKDWTAVSAVSVEHENDDTCANSCDLGMNLMQRVAASHLNVFKRFCRSCLAWTFIG